MAGDSGRSAAEQAIDQRDLLVLGYLEGACDYLRKERDDRARQIIEAQRAKQPKAPLSNPLDVLLARVPPMGSTVFGPPTTPSPITAAVREAVSPVEQRLNQIRRSVRWYLDRCPIAEQDGGVLRDMESAPLFSAWFPYTVLDRLLRASAVTPVRASQLRYLGFVIAGAVEPRLFAGAKANALAEPVLPDACAEIGVDAARLTSALAAEPDRDPIALVRNVVWVALGGPAPSAAGPAGEYQVFVSYDSQNREQAEKVASALGAKGVRTFLASRDLKSGDPWAERIRLALVASSEVCVLCSPESAKSEWVTTEWGAAWALGKTVVPILYRVDLGHLPVRLRSLQAMDLDKLDAYVNDVVGRKAAGTAS